MKNLTKLLQYLKPFKKECILGPIFKLGEAIFELLLPTIMALIINNGVGKHDSHYVLKMGITMICMSLLGVCCSLTCQYFAARASQGFGTNLRNGLFEHISSLSYVEIDEFGVASLINRVTNDVNQLQLAVAMLIRLVVRAPFICIGSIVMAMLLNFKLALILIISAPIFGLILYFVISKTSPLYKLYQKKLDNLALVLRENLSGVRVIRAFAKTKIEENRFEAAKVELTDTGIHVGRTSALLNPLTTLVMNIAIVVILWVSGIKINNGSLSQGVIIAFINYVTQILLALIVVSNLVIIYTKAFTSAKRVIDVLDSTTSIPNSIELNNNSTEKDKTFIEFKNVSFGYNSTGEVALNKVSLSIKKGETIGIIGGTGAGKSTFVNLIPRFYEVTSGEILINGVNIKKYALQNLRDKFGIVPQKSVLFTGTIAENIRFGKEDATDKEIIEAAKIAQAHEFISKMQDGYNTSVSKGGINFSGGQKQRLAIARAVVKKPEILILDDSSSALDFATDAALRGSIKSISEDITVLMVSQRASSIKNSDKIIVFNDGDVVGIGSHEELMRTCEIYKEICLSQLSEKEAAR